MPKNLHLFFTVDSSDDDVSVSDIFSQCGYNCQHNDVMDFDLVGVVKKQGIDLMHLHLALKAGTATLDLPALVDSIAAAFTLSHPAACSYKVAEWRIAEK
jgi:hypothetical protein